MRILALLLILAQVNFAEVNKGSESLKKPTEIVVLVDQARTLPGEFRADALLRLAASSLVVDRDWKRELVEDAFWSSSSASLPYMQTVKSSDLVAINEFRANRLEALTLQSRAVQRMLDLNHERALYLFEQIPPTSLPKLACSSPATPNLLDYYQAALNIFENSFTIKQRRRGDDINLLKDVIGNIQSPSQVPPALEMAFAVKVRPAQRTELIGALATKLQDVSGSEREYSALEQSLVPAISSDVLRPSDATILLPALRSYVVKYLKGRQCGSNIPKAAVVPYSVSDFNALAAKFDPEGSRYKQISLDEIKRTETENASRQNISMQSAQALSVSDSLKWLTHGDRERNGEALRWSAQERASPEWLARYDDTVKLVQDLNESDEPSNEAYFCTKADALNVLAALAPPGTTRDKAMEEYRQFLEEYYSTIQNRNLWFTMFRHMLYTARFSTDANYREWILRELMKSSNQIIVLYATLELRAGPPKETYPTWHIQAAVK